jgi:cobalt-zinc-cadmium efflux system protein
MGHHHHHGHGHHHHGNCKNDSAKNLKLAFLLNFVFSLIELIGGMYTGSMAILADALHDFGDSASLGIALFLENLAARRSNQIFSYGYRRLSLLSALITGGILVIGSIAILSQAIPRLVDPVQPNTQGMFWLALLGMSVNGFAAWRTHRGKTLNERVVSWHLIEDVLGWTLVLIISVVMSFVYAPILDPILSIVFSFVVVWGVFKHLKESLRLFLQAAPRDVDLPDLKQRLITIPGIANIHDLHFWSLDGENHVLTMHVILKEDRSIIGTEAIKARIKEETRVIGNVHTTIEFECPNAECEAMSCVLD